MMAGMFVFARGTAGITEASATRSPENPRTRPDGSTTHPAGAAHIKGARDVRLDVVGEALLVAHQLAKIGGVAGQPRQDRIAQARADVDQFCRQRCGERVRFGALVEPAQVVGKAHRKRTPAQRADSRHRTASARGRTNPILAERTQ